MSNMLDIIKIVSYTVLQIYNIKNSYIKNKHINCMVKQFLTILKDFDSILIPIFSGVQEKLGLSPIR